MAPHNELFDAASNDVAMQDIDELSDCQQALPIRGGPMKSGDKAPFTTTAQAKAFAAYKIPRTAFTIYLDKDHERAFIDVILGYITLGLVGYIISCAPKIDLPRDTSIQILMPIMFKVKEEHLKTVTQYGVTHDFDELCYGIKQFFSLQSRANYRCSYDILKLAISQAVLILHGIKDKHAGKLSLLEGRFIYMMEVAEKDELIRQQFFRDLAEKGLAQRHENLTMLFESQKAIRDKNRAAELLQVNQKYDAMEKACKKDEAMQLAEYGPLHAVYMKQTQRKKPVLNCELLEIEHDEELEN